MGLGLQPKERECARGAQAGVLLRLNVALPVTPPPHPSLPLPTQKDKSGREKQRAAANAKVQDLIAAYGREFEPGDAPTEARGRRNV